jgi:hypothetical protein
VGKTTAANLEERFDAGEDVSDYFTFSKPRLLQAAERADWGQVVANGGPPCFHLDDDGSFCLRAERWQGHTQRDRWPEHRFVSLRALLELWPLAGDKLPPSPRRSTKR